MCENPAAGSSCFCIQHRVKAVIATNQFIEDLVYQRACSTCGAEKRMSISLRDFLRLGVLIRCRSRYYWLNLEASLCRQLGTSEKSLAADYVLDCFKLTPSAQGAMNERPYIRRDHKLETSILSATKFDHRAMV